MDSYGKRGEWKEKRGWELNRRSFWGTRDRALWARTGGAEDAQRLPGEERVRHAGYRTGQDHLRGAQLVVRVLGEERAERDGWGEAREEEKGDGR